MHILKQLNGPVITPKSGKTRRMVVFLHGYGSDGNDLISIGSEWQDDMPDTVFISPNAPDRCEQSPMGYQWFSIRAIDKASFEREKQIERVTPVLDAFLDEQLKQWNVDESRLAVVGFSQGAMMAMYAMPRRRKRCGAVVGYSGMLIDAAGLTNPCIVKPPILAIHGDRDEIVPPFYLQEVQTGFGAANFPVETILRPGLAHGIDHFGLQRGCDFIKEHLAQ